VIHSESRMLASSHIIPCCLPTGLFENMHPRALQGCSNVKSLALAALTDDRDALAGADVALRKDPPDCPDVTTVNVRVIDDLYRWLRETDFHARVSMNSLVVAALRRSQAAHYVDEAPLLSLDHRHRASKGE